MKHKQDLLTNYFQNKFDAVAINFPQFILTPIFTYSMVRIMYEIYGNFDRFV